MFEKEVLNKSVEGLTEEQATAVMTLLKNSTKAYDEKLINKTVGETYGKFDKIAKDAGFEIESGKTTEFIMNKFADAKTREAENIELRAKIKSNNPDGLIKLQEEIKNLKTNGGKKYEQANKDLQTQLDGKSEAFETYRTESEAKFQEQGLKHQTSLMRNALMSRMPKIKEGIAESVSKLVRNQALDNLLKQSNLNEDGSISFKDDKGNLLMNADNANAVFSIEEMFAKDEGFKEIADSGNNNSGMNIKDKIKSKDNQVQDISNFKTKEELYTHLRDKQGLTSEAFQEAYNEQVKLIK